MLLIKNGRILTMENGIIENGSILIKNGKIAEIGENINAPDARILDACGGWVLPGLIEAHCHIGISEEKMGFEGNDCNETTEPITPYLKAIDAVNAMDSSFGNAVRAGITSVMTGPGSSNVVGGQFVFMKTKGRIIDNMVVKEPAAMKVAFGENPKSNYNSQGKMPTTRMTVAAMLRRTLEEAKQYLSGDSYDFTKECWRDVFSGKMPLKAHVHRTDDIMTAIRIAKEYGLDITLDHCTEGHLIASEIKKSGFPAIVGPSIASRNKIEVQYMDFKTAGILAKEGVLVAITTDHPVSHIQYLPVCAGFAAKAGLGIEEALRSITINPAKICRVDDRVGSIKSGKDADIAIFSGNPMETFTKTLYTIIDGEVVFDYRKGDC